MLLKQLNRRMIMGLTTQEAAAILGIKISFISRLCRSGRLKAVMHGRDWDIDPDSVRIYKETPKNKGGRPKKTK
jgi:excisionase family DNA binding protein